MTRPLTVGSLCTGYGGLEMALNLLFGPELIDVRWHAETDPDASAVLKRWFDVPNLGDLTSAGFWDTAEVTDVQVGGIPCQPFSETGNRRGTEDHRYLWPAWLRGIETHRPRLVVLENVANLVRGRMRAVFDVIASDLNRLGYAVRWCVFGACAVGAAHHRHRVFLLAVQCGRHGDTRETQVRPCGFRRCPIMLPSPRAREGTGGPGHGKNKQGGNSLTTVVSRELPVDRPEDFGRYAQAVATHTAVLGRPAPAPAEIGPRGAQRIRAEFSEWLMMLPEGHLTSVLGRNAALTRAGNGVVPRQAATALALLLTDLTGEGPPWSG
jgi:DNA (cytosine-5)-methyltransferase 1